VSMHDEENDVRWDRVRETYHVPPEAPRAEMWTAISEQIGGSETNDVVDLNARRSGRMIGLHGRDPVVGWAVAAAAVLIMGVGIGRMTAPDAGTEPTTVTAELEARDGGLRLAAQEHLGRTESLLTLVRADARDGRVDPAVAGWASDLLAQTRLLLDAGPADDATTRDLLLDLELILVQIAAVAETGSMDEAMARTELELAIRSLEDGGMLPRLQAALPAGMAGA